MNLEATVNADKGPEVGMLEKINGGATETILLVFDAPDTARPSAIELHGSASSSGVLLALPGNGPGSLRKPSGCLPDGPDQSAHPAPEGGTAPRSK